MKNVEMKTTCMYFAPVGGCAWIQAKSYNTSEHISWVEVN